MNHLNIDIQSYERNGEIILWNIHCIINATERIALIGPNGVGKSTLLKILEGEIKEYQGSIENVGSITLGYLEQIHFSDETKTVRDELRDAFIIVRRLEKEIQEQEKIMEVTGEFDRYTEALEEFRLHGGYTYENDIEKVARGIGIFHLLERPLKEVSGGERTKIALSKILLSKPDFLLLDEPTNFIDLSSVLWLEKYLEYTWKGWYLIVSHDREFLDTTCTKVIEVLGDHGIAHYDGDYSYSVEQKEQAYERLLKRFEEQDAMIESEKKLIDRFRAGSRASFAKSRERALEKVEILEKPTKKMWVQFLFPFDKHGPETVLKIEDAFIGRRDPLFFIRWVSIWKKERVWIVWENWVWKSTLIKTVLGEIQALEWYLKLHENTHALYFSQLHEWLFTEKTIYDNFLLSWFEYSRERVGSIISLYWFEYHDGEKLVNSLSGGERSRLLFALLGQRESNFLIFDEPTNHLDYETREALEKALRNYPWAILFISHDRYFINKMTEKLWVIQDGELIVSYGNYDDYTYKLEHGIELDMTLFDASGELDLVLEEKLWREEARRIKEKFARKKRRK